MSKSIKVTLAPLAQKAMRFVRGLSSSYPLKVVEIPAVDLIAPFSHLSLPPLPVPLTNVPYPDLLIAPVHNPETSSPTSREDRSPERLSDQDRVQEKTTHQEVALLLEKIGYSIKEVKALPSGEKRITISDLLGDLHERTMDYEYVHIRRRNG